MASRFNLPILRGITRHGDNLVTEAAEPARLKLSRRSFLAISGASAAFGAVPAFLRGAGFSIIREDGRIHLLVNDERHWTIDPGDFGERASLTLSEAEGEITIRLRNAMFVGTNLPADFDCTLAKCSSKWTMQLLMACGMQVSADLLDWLNGIQAASGKWSTSRLSPFPELDIRFRSDPAVYFSTDWIYTVEGPAIVSLRKLENTLPSSKFQLTVNAEQTLAGAVPDRSTTIRFKRGDAEWRVNLGRQSTEGWSLEHDIRESLFDELWVESAQTGSQVVRTAMLRQAQTNASVLTFFPASSLWTDGGEPFALPLLATRLMFGLEQESASALVSELKAEPIWAHHADASYLFAALPDASLFEFHEGPKASAAPQVTPGLCKVCFPSDDSCVELELGVPRPIPFTWGDILAPFEQLAGWLHLLPSQHGKGLAINLERGDRLTIERPHDMVSLKFAFQNMRLITGGRPRIVPVNHHDEPRVIVEFPPQHVAEKAYFHTSLSGFGDDPPVGLVDLAEYNNADTSSPITLKALKQKLDPDSVNPQDETDDAKPPVVISKPSQLVFGPSHNHWEIPCTTEDLLDWSHWRPIVAPVAQTVKIASIKDIPPIVDPNPGDPKATQYTSIEMPWRLSLSPSDRGRWAHSVKPVESHAKAVELWHTRLGVAPQPAPKSSRAHWKERKPNACPDVIEAPTSGKAMPVDEGNRQDRIIRAIWTYGFVPPAIAQLSCSTLPPGHTWPSFPDHYTAGTTSGADPFRMSLDARDRTELVHLTSNYAITQQKYFCNGNVAVPSDPTQLLTPAPVQVGLMMLTAMGGYLEALGQWNPGKVDQNHQLTVQLWEHSTTLARDHYVKVMYKGFLMPFGLSASLVKVTQRVFTQIADKSYVAIHHQFMYIVVKNQKKTCPIAGQPFSGRAFPFSYVEPVTLQTPNLNDPTTQPWSKKSPLPGGAAQSQSLFWPMVPGKKDPQIFSFGLRFSDSTGTHTLETSMPLVFVGSDVAQQDGFGDSANGWRSQDAVRLYNGGSAAYNGSNPNLDDPWMNASFGGNKISFAKSATPGDTDFDTSSLNWRVSGLTARIDIALAGIVLPSPGDQIVVTFTEVFSGATFVQHMPSPPNATVWLNSGYYTATVTTTIAGKSVTATSPAFQFNGNVPYSLSLTLTPDGSAFSTSPAAQSGKPLGLSAMDLYRCDLPYFYPLVDSANISSASIKRITGVVDPRKFVFYPGYLQSGFDSSANPGEVLLQKHPADSLTLAFGASGQVDKAGGLASPDALVVGFSRKAGVIGGKAANSSANAQTQTLPSVETYSSGKFDPADFFGGLSSAKLLGAVKLSDIIASIAPGLVSNLGQAPIMLEQAIYGLDSATIEVAKKIAAFQNLPGNPLATQLSPPAQQVSVAAAAATDALNGSDVVAQGVAAAQLIARIIDYANALRAAIQDPASIIEQTIFELLGNAVQSIVAGAASVIGPALATVGKQLTDTLEAALSTLDTQLQTLIQAVTDQSTTLMDDLTGQKQPLIVLVPEINHLLSVEQQVAALKGNVKTLGDSIQAAAQAINPSGQQPSLQQLPQIVSSFNTVMANLRQVYEKAGLLIGVAVNVKQSATFSALLTNLEGQMLTYWEAPYTASAADLATLATNLAALEKNCVILASGWDQTTSQQILQSLRQLQKSVGQAQSFYAQKFPVANLINGYRQLQVLQKMQGQILRALAELQTLAAKALPAGVTGTVLQAAKDIQTGSLTLAATLTVAQTLLGTGANQTVEKLVATFVADSVLSGPLAAPCADLQAKLSVLRTRLSQSASDLSLLLLHYNLSIDYQRPVAVALGYINYLTVYALDTQSAVIDQIRQLTSTIQGVLCSGANSLAGYWKSFRAGLDNLPGPDITTPPPPVPNLGAVIDQLFKPDLDAIDNAFGLLCDPSQTAPSQMLRNVQGVAASFVALLRDVRTKITSIPAVLAVLSDEIKQEAEALAEELLSDLPIPTTVNLHYTFEPDIQSCEPVFLVDPDASFTVTATAQGGLNAQLNGLEASFSVNAELTNFRICLIGEVPFITLVFDSLTFTSSNGSKVDCRATLDHVEFDGELEFVQQLADILDPSDGPFIELAADSIRAGFRFAISTLTMGAFNLMQLAIEVAVALPFDGTPVRCEFSLSDQQEPFLLSCGIYGGGGFLQLQLGLDGVHLLQGALDFGVCAAISIGPLTGSGFVVAGIYFRVTGTESEVCGFVHAHGHMDIFGIISMDVDLYVGICYENGSVQGTATFTVSISIAFFSESFSLQAHYGFGGSTAASTALLDMHPLSAKASQLGPNDTQFDFESDEDRLQAGDDCYCRDQDNPPQFVDQTTWTAYYNAFA
jgi:hypothetical protein